MNPSVYVSYNLDPTLLIRLRLREGITTPFQPPNCSLHWQSRSHSNVNSSLGTEDISLRRHPSHNYLVIHREMDSYNSN